MEGEFSVRPCGTSVCSVCCLFCLHVCSKQGIATTYSVRVTFVSGDKHVGGYGCFQAHPKQPIRVVDPKFMLQVCVGQIRCLGGCGLRVCKCVACFVAGTGAIGAGMHESRATLNGVYSVTVKTKMVCVSIAVLWLSGNQQWYWQPAPAARCHSCSGDHQHGHNNNGGELLLCPVPVGGSCACGLFVQHRACLVAVHSPLHCTVPDTSTCAHM